jgi:hypothetical protein
MSKQIHEILQNNGISPRPSYYSGRGATTSDVNSDQLEKIYQQIVKVHGKEAGEAFTNMVESMANMNASAFINNCFILESSQYKWEKAKKVEQNGIEPIKDEDGNYNEAHLLISVFGAMNNKGDDTDIIRNPFLAKRGRISYEKAYMRNMGKGIFVDKNGIRYRK